MSSDHAWTNLSSPLKDGIESLKTSLNKDPQFLAFTDTKAMSKPVTFGFVSAGSQEAILVTAEPGKDGNSTVKTGSPKDALFALSAKPEHWEQFFKPSPVSPYTSIWSLIGMNIRQEGVEVTGDENASAQYTQLARRSLELLRDGLHGPMKEDSQPEMDEDHITGKYVYITPPTWGRTKLFYETAGTGKEEIVFCHTAGSDSRQYHGVMNDKKMLDLCTMYAFDLPGHGRSFPGANQIPGNHTNNEDSYVGCIREFIKALKLNKPIVCGASMAGQVCLAVAARAEEVGAGGTIPLQGCDYLDMDRQFWDKSPTVNQSLFNPEWVYGVST